MAVKKIKFDTMGKEKTTFKFWRLPVVLLDSGQKRTKNWNVSVLSSFAMVFNLKNTFYIYHVSRGWLQTNTQGVKIIEEKVLPLF